MNEDYEHTSGNQVNIPIKLCVHPNIISKGIKTWIKRSLRVITWLGYKRNFIFGAIEIKKPIKEEHSLYQPLKIHNLSYQSLQTLGVHMRYTLILTTYSLFGFFFLFLFFFFFLFMYTLFSFLFLLYLQQHVVLIKDKITPLYLTKDLHLPSLPNLNQQIP